TRHSQPGPEDISPTSGTETVSTLHPNDSSPHLPEGTEEPPKNGADCSQTTAEARSAVLQDEEPAPWTEAPPLAPESPVAETAEVSCKPQPPIDGDEQ